MRRIFFLVFACLVVSSAVAAQDVVSARLVTIGKPVSFDFSGVSLVAFAQAVFKNILGRDYVIEPDALALDRKLTISVASLPASDVAAFAERLLASQGVDVSVRDNVYYLAARKAVFNSAAAVIAPSMPSTVVAAPVAAGSVLGAVAAVARTGEFAEVYVPQNRPADFLVTVLTAVFGERVVVVAGSALVVSAESRAQMVRIRTLLESLDSPVRTVEVSASFIEVLRSNSSARGVSLVADILGAKLGVDVGARSGAVAGTSGVLSLRTANFQAVLDVLDTDGRFKQVSASRVVGDDAQKMVLSVGDETPTVGASGQDKLGNAVQSIVYRASGVILDVVPRISGSGGLTLLVDGQISSFQPTSTGVAGSPTLIKRQVKTTVSLDDGELIIIGGLDDSKTSHSESGPFFLPAAWRGRLSSDSHTDLVLILSARVIRKSI